MSLQHNNVWKQRKKLMTMFQRKRFGGYLLLVVFLALSLLMAQGSAAQATPEAEVVNEVAEREGVPVSSLSVAEMDEEQLPLSGRQLFRAKLVDETTGRVYAATVNEAGEAVDFEQAQAEERAAYEEQYGALHPDLYRQLQTMAEGETLTVAIWLRSEGLDGVSRPDVGHEMAIAEAGDAAPTARDLDAAGGSGDVQEKAPDAQPPRPAAPDSDQAEVRATIDAAEADNSQWLADQVATLQAPVLADLAERGHEPTHTSATAPLIYVELSRAAILEMAERPDVDTIYPPNENADLMDVAKPTQKADVAESWGFEGGDVSVAILEDSRVEFDNPYLELGGSSESDTVRVPGDSNVDSHATATAGMVASQHGTQEGIAQGADLYSANATTYSDSDLSDAMDWAVNNNLDIINNSWGGNTSNTNLNEHDRHLDYIVRYEADTVTVAAGNEANTCNSQTDRVASPARGYNVISVGGFNDNHTTTWDDDTVYFCSSFVDPSTGVQKPEVAASGANITSTTAVSTDWIADVGSGTSYAAPMVSGEAAILLNQDSSLAAYPETVKAIIMATALHNIEGDTRLSDVDGAGAIDIRAASHLVDEGWWAWQSVSESGFPYTYTQYAHAGETVRAVIAWNSNPASDYSTDPLEADLDLRAYDADGDFVASSASFDNSYEIVEFEAPETGYYDFRISEFRFDGTSEYVGFAFWPGHRAPAPYDAEVYDTPPTTHDYYRIETAGSWTAAGVRMPSGHDYDIFLYDGSAFADPDDHVWLEDSTLGGDTLDFVVVDGNHAPQEDYFAEAEAYSGSGGTYEIEWGDSLATAVGGSYGPYTMAPADVLRVWDLPLTSGEETRVLVRPLNGNVDLGMALFDTDSGDSTSWYQGRSQAVADVDDNGLDQDEFLAYTPTDSDEYGLVVWSNAATTSSDFNLYVDSTPPTGTIQIDGALAYANSTSVSLGMNVGDGETSVTEMRFSNDGSSWSAWEPYSGSRSWTLTSGDGLKTVYGEFRNTVSMTQLITDTIYLDTTAPTGSVVVDGGATYANSTSVSLGLSASDGLSGVDDVRFSNDGSNWSSWQSYASSASWTLSSGDGAKTVYVQYRDFAENVSSTYTDTIELDTTGPTGSVVVDGGATYATSDSVSLSLSASDGLSGVDDMRFSNDGSNWSSWQSYASSASWTLSSGDGTKTVYVQYRDLVGNMSSTYTDTIELDTTAPTASASSPESTTSTSFTVSWSASDATAGVADYDVQYRAGTSGSWTDWLTGTTDTSAVFGPDSPATVERGQTYQFRVRARDNAGNAAAYGSSDTETEVRFFDLYLPSVLSP